MISYAIAILLLPLAAFGVQIFFGKRLPRGGDWVSVGAIFLSLLLSLIVLGHAIGEYNPNYFEREQWTWMDFGGSKISLGIQLDNVAAIMLVVVTLVSALVHLYSVGYMHGDKLYHQFFAFLSLFSFSMLGLVLSDNFFCLYIFWELVGVSSYLLIGFWFEKPSAADACKKAFIVNRVGDFGMFAGILILLWQVGPLGYQEVFQAVGQGELSGGLLTLAGVCLFLGAVGKSAQFPLHVWLPDAMEGPTPVSALIHAATMVAAGVYMVTRMFPILTPDALLLIAYIGAITAILGASIAIAQNDIKRVLAYSTISQLGYMIMGLGVGAYVAGFFHLVTHAAFKACLFLGSGSVIHAMQGVVHGSDRDPQDVRNMGALKGYMPTTYWTFLTATIALAGVPLTSGFLSKDSILAGTLEFSMGHPQHFLIPLIGFGAAGITAFYMFRLVFLTFHGEARWRDGHGAHGAGHGHDSHGGHGHAGEPHESPRVMTIPLVVLAALSLWFWYSPNPVSPSGWFHHMVVKPESLATGGGGHGGHAGAVEGMTGPVLAQHGGHEGDHTAHLMAMALSVLVAGLGIWVSYRLYYLRGKEMLEREERARKESGLYKAMLNKWYFDEFYDATFIRGTLALRMALGWFDQKVIDGIVNMVGRVTVLVSKADGLFDNWVVDGAVNGTAAIISTLGDGLRRLQTGRIQSYLIMAMAGIVLMMVLRMM